MPYMTLGDKGNKRPQGSKGLTAMNVNWQGEYSSFLPFTIKYTEGNLFRIFAGLLSSLEVNAAFNL